MSFLTSMFKTEKPVIGMLHLRPLPGRSTVLSRAEACRRSWKPPSAISKRWQRGGVDGILITMSSRCPMSSTFLPQPLHRWAM